MWFDAVICPVPAIVGSTSGTARKGIPKTGKRYLMVFASGDLAGLLSELIKLLMEDSSSEQEATIVAPGMTTRSEKLQVARCRTTSNTKLLAHRWPPRTRRALESRVRDAVRDAARGECDGHGHRIAEYRRPSMGPKDPWTFL